LDILTQRGIAHAAVDLDGLGLAYVPSAAGSDELMDGNLHTVCQNYTSAGVRHFLVARAMGARAEVELCRDAASATTIAVCRLTARLEAMRERVKMRELGMQKQEYMARGADLNDILDRARLEDFTVANQNRPWNDVAHEVLVKARWI
jgi:hypothetical protein